MLVKFRNKVIPFILPVIFFLLPWQTRCIFAQNSIAGEISEYGTISLYAVEVLVVLAFLLYGRLGIFEKYKRVVELSFLILCLAMASILWAINGDAAFGQFIHILVAMMLFWLLLDPRTDLKHVAIGFVAGLIIPAGLGIWQVIAGGSMASTLLGLAARDAQVLGDSVTILSDGTRILRAYGSFGHPNIFGGYLVVGLLSLFLVPVSFLRRQESSDVRVRVIWWLLLTILSIILILTYSQSAWLALVVALTVGVVMSGRSKLKSILTKKYIWILFSIFCILFSIFAIISFDKIDVDQASITERAEQYIEWPSIVSGYEVLGLGLGNYTYTIEQYDQSREWWRYQPVHSTPLLIIGEIGLLGLVLIGLWIMSIDKINFNTVLPFGKGELEGVPGVFRSPPIIALMMGITLLIVASLDHYLWTQWTGLAIVVYVMAWTVRSGEE